MEVTCAYVNILHLIINFLKIGFGKTEELFPVPSSLNGTQFNYR